MPIRRPIEEFLAAIKLENKAGFIFVEGPSDRIIIYQFVHFLKNNDWAVYDCTQIEFTDDDQEGGNRARLMKLSQKLTKNKSGNAVCIIDRDLDVFKKPPMDGALTLLITDFANMLMYGLNIDEFADIVSRYINSTIPHEITDRGIQIANFIFFIRKLKDEKNIKRRIPKIAPHISQADTGYVLDVIALTSTLKDAANEISEAERNSIAAQISSLRERRLFINDHDFAEIFGRLLRLHKRRNVVSIDDIKSILRSQISPERCSNFQLFQSLTEKISAFRSI